MDREDRDRFIAMYPDGLPALFVGGNGKGYEYVRCAPPPASGKPRGNTETVAPLILGEEAKGGRVGYRDGDRFNLCRDNLKVTGKATANSSAIPPRRSPSAPAAEDGED